MVRLLVVRRRVNPLLSEKFKVLKNLDGTDNSIYSGLNMFRCYKDYYTHIYDIEYRSGERDLASIMVFNG